MIEQIRTLLQQRQVTRAVIVDDAFDDEPAAGEIADGLWDRFFDDWADADEKAVASAYGEERYAASDTSELRRDQPFISVVWGAKSRITAAGPLFEEFERQQEQKRGQLEPLRRLLAESLTLTCETIGRYVSPEVDDAQIIFLDLFLGFMEDEEAIKRAIARVKAVVERRRESPPSVILLSGSQRLHELGPRLRDEAELLGCQFRMLRKADLAQEEIVIAKLYELVVSYPDALKINGLVLAWNAALESTKAHFLRSLRTLDLADYANVQALILEAEGEPVGDYVLDLYDLHLHNLLEGQGPLIRAAKALNEISWDDYPPAQFSPSDEVVEMMDGAMSHNQVRTDTEAAIDAQRGSLRLGDVFFSPIPLAAVAPVAPVENDQIAPAAVQIRYAYVVISQSCDLQHCETDRVLLLRGEVLPYGWKQHDNKSSGPRTSIIRVDRDRFSIIWDVVTPETWLISDVPNRLRDGYRRVRRLRTPFALQLQQSFIGRLGRVGTLAALPTRHAAGVRVFLKNRAGVAVEMLTAGPDTDEAVCLVGRTDKNAPKEWLLLSDGFIAQLRAQIRAVPIGDLPGGAPSVAIVRDDPAFYRQLKKGLLLNRDAVKGTKPFSKTDWDVVQILTRATIEAGELADRSFHPIIVEVAIE